MAAQQLRCLIAPLQSVPRHECFQIQEESMERARMFFGAAAPLLLATAMLAAAPDGVQAAPQCNLGNGIKHVIQIQFDNVHLRRDNPNVPSDLEQIRTCSTSCSATGRSAAIITRR
jgi:hypothetical protein